MEKPYDLSVLAAKAKARGLNLVEDEVKMFAEEFFGWFEESAKLSSTPYDDMAAVVLPPLKKIVFGEIDKIDGQVGA